MKVILVKAGGQAPRLIWEKAPDPAMGPEEVLVAVRATAQAFQSEAKSDAEWKDLNFHSRPDLAKALNAAKSRARKRIG